MSDYTKYFSTEARDARRASRLSQMSEIKGTIGHRREAATDKLTTQNAGLKAVALAREILNNYNLPGLPKLSYSGIRGGRTAADSSKLVHGVITVNANLKSASGVQISFDMPIEILDGKLQDPSVIVHNGEPRIIAQSSFDGIVSRNTVRDYVPVRDLYAAPLDNGVANELYKNRIKQTSVNRGMFSVQANRENLRRAMRGQDPIVVEAEVEIEAEEPFELEAAAVKNIKPPKPPKTPGIKPPKPPPLKSKPTKGLCSKCSHSPCVCSNKRKKKSETDVYKPIALKKVSDDLVAKVNQEISQLRDSGLSDIDIKQAVFSKYGPHVAASVFEE